MPPTTSIRWDLAKQIIELLRGDNRLAGALIEPGWPGETELKPDTVWIDQIEGEVTCPFTMADRKVRDDRFTIPIEIRIVDRPNLDALMDRVEEIRAAIEDMCANDPTLSNFGGLMQALESTSRTTSARTPDGVIAFGEVAISAWARYE